MKQLLYKEMRLCLHPTVFLFLSFVAMLLIPNYWYLVPCFFSCQSIFYVFLSGRETNDVLFTATLPVAKRDVVRARVLTVALIQLAMVVLMVPMLFLRRVLMADGNAAGLDANFFLLAVALVLFGLFNIVFLPAFYKTGRSAGKAFILSTIVFFAVMVLVEACSIAAAVITEQAATMPDSAWCAPFVRYQTLLGAFPDTTEAWTAQLVSLGCGALLYALLTALACKSSIRRFEKVDL